MNLDELLQPVTSDAPAGVECVYKPKYRELAPLVEFLVARADMEELRRRERMPYEGDGAESERRFARDALAAADERFKQTTARVRDLLGASPSPTSVARAIETRCVELLRTTGKDLEVVQQLALASLQLHGVQGLAEVAELFERLLDAYPDTLHPLPEEVEPDDPPAKAAVDASTSAAAPAKLFDLSARAMVLGEIVNGSGFVSMVREAVVVASGPGRMIFRDAEVLDEAIEADPAGGGLSGPTHLRAILQADLAQSQDVPATGVDDAALRAHLAAVMAPLQAVEERLRKLIGRFKPGLIPGERVLVLIHRSTRRLGLLHDELGAAAASAAVDAAAGLAHDPSRLASANMAAVNVAGGMRLATRDDARRMILEVASFLERSEPGHPSPLFLRRAEKLLGAASFFDIVRDMFSSSTLDEVTHLTGQKPAEPPAES